MSRKQIIHGIHAVQAALEYDSASVIQIFYDRSRQDQRLIALLQQAQAQGVAQQPLARQELGKRAASERHQGVIAEVREPEPLSEKDLDALLERLQEPAFLLVLDGVTDPHNLGACLRTADAVGVHAIIGPKDRAVGLTATVRKVASGAAETVPYIQVTNLSRMLKQLQARGIWVIGTDGEGEGDLFQTDLSGPLALVMGAEGHGMRRLTRENCDLLMRIPMNGTVESLNVSVASAVCLYEALRQRRSMAGG